MSAVVICLVCLSVYVCVCLYVYLSVSVCGLKYLLHVTELYTSQGDVSFTLDILKELTSQYHISVLRHRDIHSSLLSLIVYADVVNKRLNIALNSIFTVMSPHVYGR